MTGRDDDLLAAAALDAATAAEQAELEDLLRRDPGARRELAAHRETLARLSGATAVPPPADLRAKVLAQVARTPQVAPGPGSPADTGVSDLPSGAVTSLHAARRRRWSARRLTAGLAAAAAVAAFVAWGPWRSPVSSQLPGSSQTPVSPAEQVLAAADARRMERRIGAATATVVVSRSLNRAVVITEAMPPAPSGKDYQLWFNQPGRGMVNGGLMPKGGTGKATVVVDGDAATATALGITVEPSGGSTTPTGTPVAVIPIEA